MTDIEIQRQANIKKNQEHLKQLGILYTPQPTTRENHKRPPPKKRKLEPTLPPSRSSARIASAPVRLTYDDDVDDDDNRLGRAPRKKARAIAKQASNPIIKQEPTASLPSKDINSIRAGWTSWTATASPPTRDANSTFHFDDEATFTPNKSPSEMLQEGCFGGHLFPSSLHTRPRHYCHRRLSGTTPFLDLGTRCLQIPHLLNL